MGLISKIASSNSDAKVPTRASTRRVLISVLRTDPLLNDFCLDFFPEVAGEFTIGMARSVKFNILLSREGTDDVLTRLKEAHAEATARHEHLIVLGDGNDTLPTSLLDARERRNRQRMIQKVRKFWIEGVLEKSLHGAVMIELGKEYRPDAVAYPWDMVLEGPDTEPLPIPKGKKMIELFDENLGELLILGAPGSGKTTMLLDLCRDLLRQAEVDETYPIPVVFKLSSWAFKRHPFGEWLVEELNLRYDVPRSVAHSWLSSGQILLLLDGLDEMLPEYRVSCVEEINRFRQIYGLIQIALTSRTLEYDDAKIQLKLYKAVHVQKLTLSQATEYLQAVGVERGLVELINQNEHGFSDLAQTPLLLGIFALVAHELSSTSSTSEEDFSSTHKVQNKLFELYLSKAFIRRKTPRQPYDTIHLLKHLSWLAQQMKRHALTIFYIEELQPTYISTRISKLIYGIGARMSWFMILLGFCGGFLDPEHPLGNDMVARLIFGCILGTGAGLIFGVIGLLIKFMINADTSTAIRPVESITFSWAALQSQWVKIKRAVYRTFGMVFVLTLIASLSKIHHYPYTFDFVSPLLNPMACSILVAILYSVRAALGKAEIPTRERPNEGIWRSIRLASISSGIAFVVFMGTCYHGIIEAPAVQRSAAVFLDFCISDDCGKNVRQRCFQTSFSTKISTIL